MREEMQELCRSNPTLSPFFACFTIPNHGNGQRNVHFWDWTCNYYNKHPQSSLQEKSTRSLESKCSIIKHDVTKFIRHDKVVGTLNKYGSSAKHVMQKSLQIYYKRKQD